MANTKAIGVAYSDQALVNGSVDNSPIGANTPNTGAFTTLSANSFTTSGTTPNYFAGNVVVETNSSLAALRVTQVGSGDALLIEDSGNPDSTPFVINNVGNVGIGLSAIPAGYKLELAPDAAGTTLRLRGGSGGSSLTQFTDAAASAQWGTLTASASSIGLAHNAVLAFTTNTVERLRILASGVISLGATTGAESLRVTPVTSAVNCLEVTGAITTAAPSLIATGSDTNIDIKLTPKGTGVVQYGTYTAGAVAQAGYITIKDAGGTTRRLLVG